MINIINKNKTYITLNGFTLAEVLITLGIIGIVAAMTLPSLIANYRSKVAVTQLKKMYSVMSQAMLFKIQQEGDDSSLFELQDADDQSIKNWYLTNLKPYIKVTNECFNKSGCWADTPTKFLNGNTATLNRRGVGVGNNIVVFNTVDGYAINLDAYGNDQGRSFGVKISNTSYLVVLIDINGKKLPNIIGKDIFAFVLSSRGFVPAGKDSTDDQVGTNCSKNGNGYYCFEKIMRNGWEIDKENLW